MMKKLTQYKKNNNITYFCNYHIIWCTKYRRDLLKNGADTDLINIIQDVANELNVDIIEIEVMLDHVHILANVDPQLGVHKFIKTSKGRSSRQLRIKHKALKSRVPTLWTNSYFISTVGGATLDVVKKYIEDQKNV